MRGGHRKKFTSLPDVIFIDLDNTLYPYEPAQRGAIESVEKKLRDSLGIKRNEFTQAFKNAREQVKKRLAGSPSCRSRLLYFQALLENFGLGSSVLNALDLEQTYWRNFLRNAELFEGVSNFLEDVRLRNIPIVLVSNLTTQIQFRKLVYLGVEEYFNFVVTSEEIGVEKPDARIFIAAAEKCNKMGGNIWMIGDDPICDICGSSEALNCLTILKVSSLGSSAGKRCSPDFIFKDYNKLSKLLDSIES